jgi:hypothetical protein
MIGGRADKNGRRGTRVSMKEVSFTLDTSDRQCVWRNCMTTGEFTRVGYRSDPPPMAWRGIIKDPQVVVKEDNGQDADKESDVSGLQLTGHSVWLPDRLMRKSGRILPDLKLQP